MAVALGISQERRKSCFHLSRSSDSTWEADSSFKQIYFLLPLTKELMVSGKIWDVPHSNWELQKPLILALNKQTDKQMPLVKKTAFYALLYLDFGCI